MRACDHRNMSYKTIGGVDYGAQELDSAIVVMGYAACPDCGFTGPIRPVKELKDAAARHQQRVSNALLERMGPNRRRRLARQAKRRSHA